MKRKITLPLVAGAAVMILSASTVINQNGVANWTGSPVDGGTGAGGTCLNCHNSSGTAPSLSVTTSPAFASGNQYTPSTVYTVNVTVSGSQAKYGFNCEIINSQSTSTSAVGMFGAFGSVVTSNCKIYTAAQATPYPPCASHTAPSGTGGTCTFSFKWTAPASGTGYLYAIGLGANNDGTDVGDHQSAVTSMTLTPATSSGIEAHEENSSALNVFPNPATDNVRLTYTLTEKSHVIAKLYTMNGELAAELLNDTQDRGMQAVDTRLPIGLAKGMYMVRLIINGKQILQKLTVF